MVRTSSFDILFGWSYNSDDTTYEGTRSKYIYNLMKLICTEFNMQQQHI